MTPRTLLALTTLLTVPLFAAPPAEIPAVKPRVISTPPPKAPVKKPRSKPRVDDSENAAPKRRATPPPEPPLSRTEERVAAYMPKVKAALGKRWSESLKPRLTEFSPGSVALIFTLDAEGKVTDVKLGENTSNEPFGRFCEQFVRETVFEAPPARVLTDGRIEVPFTFWIY
jgi:TonB family protein